MSRDCRISSPEESRQTEARQGDGGQRSERKQMAGSHDGEQTKRKAAPVKTKTAI